MPPKPAALSRWSCSNTCNSKSSRSRVGKRLHIDIPAAPRASAFGLGRKFVVRFGALISIFSVVALFTNQHVQRQMLETRLEARAVSLGDLLSGVAAPRLRGVADDDFDGLLRQVFQQTDIETLYVADSEGQVVARGNLGAGQLPATVEDPLVDEALLRGARIARRTPDSLQLAIPVVTGDRILGIVRVDLSLDHFNRDVAVVRILNGAIGAYFVAFGVIMSTAVAGRVTKPLGQLISVTEAASRGELEHDIRLRTNDEIEQMAGALNRLLTALRASLNHINHLAYRDKLTGLANRAWLTEYLAKVSVDVRTQGTRAAILFLDLDRFKQVNDTLGHSVGDELLKGFADRLKEAVGSCGWKIIDTPGSPGRLRETGPREAAIARLGGDEFTVVLFGDAPESAAEMIAADILDRLDVPFPIGPHALRSSTSIGLAFMPEHASVPRDVMKRADDAMYRAKQAGRGTYRVFDASMNAAEIDRDQIRRDLRTALAEDQFEVFFQPQFEVATERLVGAEALIRWLHPRLGMLQPGDFLPVARTVGLMPDIGRIVLAKALRLAMEWPSSDGCALRLALNLSTEELTERPFMDFLLEEIGQSDIDPARLEIEVSESAAMHDSAEAVRGFALLRRSGVRLAVDNFGTGYSNLARLKALDFDRLKIDRSLLAGVGIDRDAEALVGSILHIAAALGLEVVGEGIEDLEQLAFLKKAGCQIAQGYSLGRPMAASSFLSFASAHSLPNAIDVEGLTRRAS